MDCQINTSAGPLTFELTYKKVKNINLRSGRTAQSRSAHPGGQAALPLSGLCGKRPTGSPVRESGQCSIHRLILCLRLPTMPPAWPSFPPISSATIPFLPRQSVGGRSSGSRRCARCGAAAARQSGRSPSTECWPLAPREAVEYVILHEYLHFWYPDHGKYFHQAFDRLMPDNRQRRALLRGLLR